jgi:hypothetical protein
MKLGYAFMNVVDNTDWKRGPLMSEMLWNPRAPGKKGVQELSKKVLLREVPRFALVLAVKPELIERSSLKRDDPDMKYSHVRWATGAKDTTTDGLVLVNGKHRVEVVRKHIISEYTTLLGTVVKEFEGLDKSVPKNAARMNLLEVEKERIGKLIEGGGNWLCAFYDMGKYTS